MEKEGKYYSFYDKSFEYILGEEIKPEKSDCYLYFYSFKDRKTSTYYNEKNNYVLKAKVNLKDILSLDYVLRVKKCIPLEVIAKEIVDKEGTLPF
jgi:hypothetical protein